MTCEILSNRFAYFIVLPPVSLFLSLSLSELPFKYQFKLSDLSAYRYRSPWQTQDRYTTIFIECTFNEAVIDAALVYPVILHRHLSKLENSVALGGGTNKAKSRKKLLFTDSRASVLERRRPSR